MEDGEAEDCGDPLVRALFDISATVAWLVGDAEDGTRLTHFAAAHQRDLDLLAKTDIAIFKKLLADATAYRDLFPGMEEFTGSRARLPGLEKRIKGHPLSDHYFRYRDLSRRSHASMTSATMYLGQADLEQGSEPSIEIPISETHAREFAENYLAYGAIVAYYVAVEAPSAAAVCDRETLARVGLHLGNFWAVEEGKPLMHERADPTSQEHRPRT
ncbi:MAG TPA: hypothetical protein VIG64_08365 [Actinomycetota bacterium]